MILDWEIVLQCRDNCEQVDIFFCWPSTVPFIVTILQKCHAYIWKWLNFHFIYLSWAPRCESWLGCRPNRLDRGSGSQDSFGVQVLQCCPKGRLAGVGLSIGNCRMQEKPETISTFKKCRTRWICNTEHFYCQNHVRHVFL